MNLSSKAFHIREWNSLNINKKWLKNSNLLPKITVKRDQAGTQLRTKKTSQVHQNHIMKKRVQEKITPCKMICKMPHSKTKDGNRINNILNNKIYSHIKFNKKLIKFNRFKLRKNRSIMHPIKR